MRREKPVLLDSTSPPAVLGPVQGNLHTVRNVGQEVCFALKILSDESISSWPHMVTNKT